VVTVTAAALKPSDRWMASGVHYAPTAFPTVVGLDGVGLLPDGARVAFFGPQPPYGGMAEQALVRRGRWLPVPDGIDEVGRVPSSGVTASSRGSRWPAVGGG
jgi:NADPH2:quinone reductase